MAAFFIINGARVSEDDLTEAEVEEQLMKFIKSIDEDFILTPANWVFKDWPFAYEVHAQCRKCGWSFIEPGYKLGFGGNFVHDCIDSNEHQSSN